MRGTHAALAALCSAAVAMGTGGCGGDDDSAGAESASTTRQAAAQTQSSTQAAAAADGGPLRSSYPRPTWSAHPDANVRRLIVKDLGRGDGETLRYGQMAVVEFIGSDYVTGKAIPRGSLWGRGRTYSVEIRRDYVLPGWHKGLPGMQVGGRRALVIPPRLGFQGLPSQDDRLTGMTTYYVIDLLGVERAPRTRDEGGNLSLG